MINRIVIKLLSHKLGVKRYEKFRFTNQKTDDIYYFTNDKLMKIYYRGTITTYSNVSLNWLLNKECKVRKI